MHGVKERKNDSSCLSLSLPLPPRALSFRDRLPLTTCGVGLTLADLRLRICPATVTRGLGGQCYPSVSAASSTLECCGGGRKIYAQAGCASAPLVAHVVASCSVPTTPRRVSSETPVPRMASEPMKMEHCKYRTLIRFTFLYSANKIAHYYYLW